MLQQASRGQERDLLTLNGVLQSNQDVINVRQTRGLGQTNTVPMLLAGWWSFKWHVLFRWSFSFFGLAFASGTGWEDSITAGHAEREGVVEGAGLCPGKAVAGKWSSRHSSAAGSRELSQRCSGCLAIHFLFTFCSTLLFGMTWISSYQIVHMKSHVQWKHNTRLKWLKCFWWFTGPLRFSDWSGIARRRSWWCFGQSGARAGEPSFSLPQRLGSTFWHHKAGSLKALHRFRRSWDLNAGMVLE